MPQRLIAGLAGYLSLAAIWLTMAVPAQAADEPLQLTLTYQTETSPGTGRYHRLARTESWAPRRTAIIVCDMWDLHHCRRAVLRETEFAPRLNQLLNVARERGVTIIHAPSDCMAFYANHLARQRAVSVPRAKDLPADIGQWCRQIPAEERGEYPIDQTHGGEDDDPDEHAAWAAELKAKGLDPRKPWTRQTPLVQIDEARDYISDKGEEIWSILAERGIDHVILSGVHTNMCVLGRPFGLRQMVKNGKQAALLRDMTDTMYNPAAKPYVSHFTGTDLIISHIERFVCPTITSDQFLGGQPFRFSGDTRKRVAMVIAEDEYKTEHTLPAYALSHLGKEFQVNFIFGSDTERGDIPGIEAVRDADVLLVSVRRRPLRPEQLAMIREFVAAGKPVIGIRTASHAFCLRNAPPPEGLADWTAWDAEVFGGNYTNHHKNDLASMVTVVPSQQSHPILSGLPAEFPQQGSLYRTAPLKAGAVELLSGRLTESEAPAEPVAWTFTRADGGQSFYTSLGHEDDFAGEAFPRLLTNAIRRAASVTPSANAK